MSTPPPEVLRHMAKALDFYLNPDREQGEPREVGFVLMVFDYAGDEDVCKCVSNGVSRKTVIDWCRKTIAELERSLQ
jgi:hypothetical protein